MYFLNRNNWNVYRVLLNRVLSVLVKGLWIEIIHKFYLKQITLLGVFLEKKKHKASKGKMEKASVVSSGENELLWKSEPQPESIVSVTLSRAVTSLLSARPNKLHDSISRLSHSPTASLHDSLRFFHTYVTDAVNHNRSFDQLLLPIIHTVIQSQSLSPPHFFFN